MLNSELKYFSKGIEWFDQHDMSGILAQSGIVPSSNKTYNVKEINDAVKANIGTDVGVECWKDPVSRFTWNHKQDIYHSYVFCFCFQKTQIVYLFEIRICYNKNLGLTDCDGIKAGSDGYSKLITNCHEDEQIVYPDKVPEYFVVEKPLILSGKSWLIRFYKFIRVLQWLTY